MTGGSRNPRVSNSFPKWLLDRLAQHSFDGTEIFRVIEREFPGPDHEISMSAIRHALIAQYRNTVPIDVVIEIIAGILDDGEPA